MTSAPNDAGSTSPTELALPVTATRERYDYQRAALNELAATLAREELEARQLRQAADRRRAEIEQEASDLADPTIDAFLTWIDQRLARQMGRVHSRRALTR